MSTTEPTPSGLEDLLLAAAFNVRDLRGVLARASDEAIDAFVRIVEVWNPEARRVWRYERQRRLHVLGAARREQERRREAIEGSPIRFRRLRSTERVAPPEGFRIESQTFPRSGTLTLTRYAFDPLPASSTLCERCGGAVEVRQGCPRPVHLGRGRCVRATVDVPTVPTVTVTESST